MFKKIGLIALAIVIVIGLVAGALYRFKLVKAELTNITLAEKLRLSEATQAQTQEKFDLLGEISTLKISALEKTVIEKEQASQAIVVKQASEIKALRFTAGTWEDKYNRLEPECLKLSAKVTAQGDEIGVLKLTIGEMQTRDLIRLQNIKALTCQLDECQDLLAKSIKNTASIIKKGWILKIFDRLKFGPGGGIGSDGKGHIGIFAILAVN